MSQEFNDRESVFEQMSNNPSLKKQFCDQIAADIEACLGQNIGESIGESIRDTSRNMSPLMNWLLEKGFDRRDNIGDLRWGVLVFFIKTESLLELTVHCRLLDDAVLLNVFSTDPKFEEEFVFDFDRNATIDDVKYYIEGLLLSERVTKHVKAEITTVLGLPPGCPSRTMMPYDEGFWIDNEDNLKIKILEQLD